MRCLAAFNFYHLMTEDVILHSIASEARLPAGEFAGIAKAVAALFAARANADPAAAADHAQNGLPPP